MTHNAFGQVANDDCGSAQPITVPSSGNVCINGTNTNAQSDGGTNGCDAAPAGNEVWFTFVATGALNTITVSPNGTPISDIAVTIYTGGCAGLFIESCTNAIGGAVATDNVGLVPGTQVWISVESEGTDGDFELCIESSSPPGNPGNNCANAAPLCRKEPFSYGTLNGYTPSGFKPTCFGSPVQRDIWFKFTVGQTGTLEWSAQPLVAQEYDWALYDITNGCPNNNTPPVSCNYYFSQPALGAEANAIGMGPVPAGADAGEFNAAVTVTAGRTYALIIDNYSGNNGGFDFEWGGTFKMAPKSDFELSPYQACNELTTSFVNNSYGATSYSWTFGDGTSSTAQNPPSKTYPAPGNYIVSLTTATDEGCIHTLTKVAVVSAPIVNLSSSADSICLGESVDLTGFVSTTALQNPIPFTVVEDVNVNDNDPTGFSSIINVTGVFPGTINPGEGELVEVVLNIDHKRVQDLDVSLKCPSGATIDLTSDNGGNGANYENTRFVVGGAPITGGAAPFTGDYAPEQAFTNFNGCPVNGNWELIVVDDQGGIQPYFDEWSLAFKNENEITYTWSPAADFTDQLAMNHTLTPSATGTYTLSATDALGCQEDTAITVFVEEPADAGLDTTLYICSEGGTFSLTSLIRDGSASDGTFLDPNGNVTNATVGLDTAISGEYKYILTPAICAPDEASFFVTINPAPEGTISSDTVVCPGEEVNLTIDVTVGTAPFNVVLNINGTDSIFALTGNQLVVPFTVDEKLTITLVSIEDGNSPPCVSILGSPTVVFDVFEPIDAQVTDMICAGDNQSYQIEITITGGDPGSYLVNGDAVSGTFVSAAIPNGGDYSFIVTDINNCNPIVLEGKEFCACISDAGTVEDNPLDLCEGETTTVTANSDEVVETDDVVRFVLHDSPTEAIGTIFGWSNDGVFGFAPPMQFETTYYISRIIGNPEPGNSAEVDLDDCYSMSLGTPVVFHQNPLATITVVDDVICLGDTFFFNFNATAGLEEFDVEYEISGTPGFFKNLTSPSVLELYSDTSLTIQFTNLETEHCETPLAIDIPLTVNQAPTATLSGDTALCDNGGAGTATLHLANTGQGTIWNVSYTDGTNTFNENGIGANHSFTVSPTSDTTVYQLVSVTDNSTSTCPGVLNGSAEVIIYPDPVATIDGALAFCEFSTEYLDVVVTGGTGSYDAIWINTTTNEQDTSLVSGDSAQIAISPPAGFHNFNLVLVTDQNTGCFTTGSGTATADVVAAPKMDVGGVDTVCDPGFASIPQMLIDLYNIQGTAPFTVYFNDGNTQFIETISNTNDVQISADGYFNGSQTTTYYFIDSITDGSIAQCVGYGNGQARLVVNPNPTAEIRGDALICDGSQTALTFQFSGQGTVNADVVGTDGSSFTASGTNTNPDTIYVSPGTTTTYSINNVYDNNNPSCTAPPNGSVTVEVNDGPTGNIQVAPDEICLGETFDLTITAAASANLTAYFTDENGTSFTQSIDVATGSVTYTLPNGIVSDTGYFHLTLDSLIDNSSAGCKGYPNLSDSGFVNPLPEVTLSFDESIICFGNSATLNLDAGPDAGPFTAELVEPTGTSLQSLNNGNNTLTVSPEVSFTYVATVITNTITGCTQTVNAEAAIEVKENPTFEASIGDQFCFNDAMNLDFSITGTPSFGLSFELSNGLVITDSTLSSNPRIGLPSLPVGVYSISNFGIIELDAPNCFNQRDTTITFEIFDNPNVQFEIGNAEGCAPLLAGFNNTTDPSEVESSYWTFSNGFTSKAFQVDSVLFESPGTYSVRLEVISPIGCRGFAEKRDTIFVYPNPVADFTTSPNVINIRTSEVLFENLSSHVDQSFWQFDSLGSSVQKHPTFQFPNDNEGLYQVLLAVSSEEGCTDTIVKAVEVEGLLSVNIPNAFTPDGDGVNDVFVPIIHGYDEFNSNYTFAVYDRWGVLLFESTTIGEGWDGNGKSGDPCKVGTYVYQVKVQSKFKAEVQNFTGGVNLIK